MDGADSVRYVIENDIPGAFVECGVAYAKFPLIWIEELKRLQVCDRDLYLIDTFRGMTEPGENDYTTEDAQLFHMDNADVHKYFADRQRETHNEWCCAPLSAVHARIASTGYPLARVNYIIGDVRITLLDEDNLPPAPISILRLDTDFYDSCKVELQRLYDRVTPGGIIIFDDYHHWEGQRKATDEFFAERGIKPDIVNLGNQQCAAMFKP